MMIDSSKHFLFITDILKRRVVSKDGSAAVGKIVDLIASTKELYPRIVYAAIPCRKTRGLCVVPWNKLERAENGTYLLKGEPGDLIKPHSPHDGEFLVKDEFMDMQIVDTYGCKVVRVNDLHLLKEKDNLWVVHADVGMRGLLRRLGWERAADALTEWLFSYKFKDQFISWKYVQSLAEPGKAVSVLKLRVTQEKMSRLWPADIAEMIQDLGVKERMNLFRSLDTEIAANVLKDISPNIRHAIFETLGKERAALILKELEADEIADIIAELPHRKAEALLNTLKKEKAEMVKEIAALPKNEAGSFMELNYIALHGDLTLKEAFEKVRSLSSQVELINYIYITDAEGKLAGVTTIRKILLNDPGMKLADIMKSNVIKVKLDTHRKEVIRIFVKYDFDVLPVTDEDNKMIGVIALKNSIEAMIPGLVKDM